jgi:hypothetical protein
LGVQGVSGAVSPGIKWKGREVDYSFPSSVDDNIKLYLREIGWGGMDWINLAQDSGQWRAFMYNVMNIRVSKNVGNFLTG